MSTIWQLENRKRTEIFDDIQLLLEESSCLDWLGDKSAPIYLKPNLVVAKPASTGATTTPAVAEGLILFLNRAGYKNISFAEGSWVGDSTGRAYKICGYETLSQKYNIPLLDLKKDEAISLKTHGESFKICRSLYELNEKGGSLINLPMLKGHGQTNITCALKNLKGCIPDSEKRRYHSLGVHRPVALLNTLIKPAFALVDGLNGDPGWEEGGSPQEHNLLFIGKDPVTIDSYAAKLLGYRPDEVEYILLAHQFGLGSLFSDDDLIELKETSANHRRDSLNLRTEEIKTLKKQFSEIIDDDSACSACHSHLLSALKVLSNKNPELFNGFQSKSIQIGQGFKEKKLLTTTRGIGICTAGAEKYCPGCPPASSKIIEFLSE
ncbi:MAG: DUF362 domain-containing protein [Spirochaetales bacterium]|nr:DUF362 domain-containing protein [Spirochaetales bacterium]